MTDRELLQIYTDFIPYLAKVLGPGCEIVVHDMTNPDCSLIAIENSLSGRKKGNSLTAFAKEIVEKRTFVDTNYLVNYVGQTSNKNFLSSTFFIKNEERLIGMLYINKDMTDLDELAYLFAKSREHFNLVIPQDSKHLETFDSSMDAYVRKCVSDVIMQNGVAPSRLSANERIRIVQQLHESGVTTAKGAIAEIAQQLLISIPTVYRYIKKIDKD